MKYRIVIEAELNIKEWMKLLASNDIFDKLFSYEHRIIIEDNMIRTQEPKTKEKENEN